MSTQNPLSRRRRTGGVAGFRAEALEQRTLLSTAYAATWLDGLFGNSVNDRGQVTGDFAGKAAIWSNGKITTFGPSDYQPVGNQINNAGDVVGSVDIQDATGLQQHPFYYHNGKLNVLPVPTLNLGESTALGINNHGIIVGTVETQNGPEGATFSGNTYHVVPNTVAIIAVNDAGQMIASTNELTPYLGTELLSPGGKVLKLSTIKTSDGVFGAMALNSSGDMAGMGSAEFAYLYSHGNAIKIPAPASDPVTPAEGLAINDIDEVVGRALLPASAPASANGSFVPFVYQGGVTHDLRYLVNPGVGLNLYGAVSVNNSGQILAAGSGGSYLLTPVRASSISGVVYHDANKNHLRDALELGQAGRTVFIDANDNGILDYGEFRTVTAANGSYSFQNLGPGRYTIREILPIGAQLTPRAYDGIVINLQSGQAATGKNFGNTLASTAWRVVDLGTLGGPTSVANAINDAGQIVGKADTTAAASGEFGSIHHAFVYSNGKLTDLTPKSSGASRAADINSQGQIVGEFGDDDHVSTSDQPFLYSNGKLQTLKVPPGDIGYVNAINDSGQIVGQLLLPDDNGSIAVKFAAGSVTRVLTDIYGGTTGAYAQAAAINNRGDIAGFDLEPGRRGASDAAYGEIVINGKPVIVPPDPGLDYPNSQVFGLNDKGQAVGLKDNLSFLYSGGRFQFIDNIHQTAGSSALIPKAINNSGEIVGAGMSVNFTSASDGGAHALVVNHGQLVDPNFALVNGDGWTITAANDINNNGWIVGQGINPAGQTHAVLLVPVPAEG